jgi:hypothetical protein
MELSDKVQRRFINTILFLGLILVGYSIGGVAGQAHTHEPADYDNPEVIQRNVLECTDAKGVSREYFGILAEHKASELPSHWFVMRERYGKAETFVIRIPTGGTCKAI